MIFVVLILIVIICLLIFLLYKSTKKNNFEIKNNRQNNQNIKPKKIDSEDLEIKKINNNTLNDEKDIIHEKIDFESKPLYNLSNLGLEKMGIDRTLKLKDLIIQLNEINLKHIWPYISYNYPKNPQEMEEFIKVCELALENSVMYKPLNARIGEMFDPGKHVNVIGQAGFGIKIKRVILPGLKDLNGNIIYGVLIEL